MAPTLTDVLTIAECSRDDFNNWKRRGAFTTTLPEATPGVSQELSRKTALELAFLSALAAAGFEPMEVRRETARWLKEESAGTLAPAWAANPNSRRRGKPAVQLGMGFGDFATANVDGLSVMLADEIEGGYRDGPKGEHRPATVLVLIDRAEIVRRIDELYGRK